MQYTLIVAVPSVRLSDRNTVMMALLSVNRAMKTLTDAYGGVSAYEGRGGWIGKEGYQAEPMVTLVVYDPLDVGLSVVHEVALSLKKELNQESIALAVSEEKFTLL